MKFGIIKIKHQRYEELLRKEERLNCLADYAKNHEFVDKKDICSILGIAMKEEV